MIDVCDDAEVPVSFYGDVGYAFLQIRLWSEGLRIVSSDGRQAFKVFAEGRAAAIETPRMRPPGLQ